MRHRQRKTDRGSGSKETMMDAAKEIIDNGASLRQTAKSHQVHYSTLCRYIQKVKSAREANMAMPNPGYQPNRKIFSDQEEKLIADYLVMAGDICYGLTRKEARHLAYQCATKFNVNFPPQWSAKSAAGEDWLSGFILRNQVLTIRTPDATSLARATSFNATTVNSFFDKLSAVIDRHTFQESDIYTLNEAEVTTVQPPSKVIARRGVKQMGALTSGERGQLVTLELAVNACGNSVPPMFVFPLANFKEHFITDGPIDCIGVAHPSGWMTDTNFVIFMRHFIKHVKPSSDHPVLLLMDNNKSHISIEAIDLCKQNGVVVLTFPPICSHKLQPLDRSVLGPFKKYFNSACDTWMKTHSGISMTIYDLPGIVARALPNAITPSNIQAGFRVSGVWPFNRHIFKEHEYLAAQATDRPEPKVPSTPTLYRSSDSADDVEETRFVEEEDDSYVRHDRLKQNDYVLVKLQGLKNTTHFVARISDNSLSNDQKMEVTYLAEKSTRRTFDDEETVRFEIPENSRTYPVPMEDIIKKLPSPLITGGTKRVSRQITFPFSFSGYNLKA